MGQMDFVIEGAMIGGYALAAAPAQYQVTGVQTFIVGPNGIVYQKDLGPETLKVFESMDRYNPDKTWKPTDDQWPEEEEEAPAEQGATKRTEAIPLGVFPCSPWRYEEPDRYLRIRWSISSVVNHQFCHEI